MIIENNANHGTNNRSPQTNNILPRMDGKIELKSKLLNTETIRDAVAIHKKDSGGLPVSISQNPIKKAVIKPYIDPITTPNGLAFFTKSALKNKLNNGAINRPLVLAVISRIFPGTAPIAILKITTTNPIRTLIILIFFKLSIFLRFLNILDRTSVVIIELIEFIPDDKLDMDAENKAAIIKPVMPTGNWVAIKWGNKKSLSTITPIPEDNRSGLTV